MNVRLTRGVNHTDNLLSIQFNGMNAHRIVKGSLKNHQQEWSRTSLKHRNAKLTASNRVASWSRWNTNTDRWYTLRENASVRRFFVGRYHVEWSHLLLYTGVYGLLFAPCLSITSEKWPFSLTLVNEANHCQRGGPKLSHRHYTHAYPSYMFPVDVCWVCLRSGVVCVPERHRSKVMVNWALFRTQLSTPICIQVK